MGKRKPRHCPDKPQNNIPKWCPYAEWYGENDEKLRPYGECGFKTDKCKGDGHNCVKVKYKREQIKRSV